MTWADAVPNLLIGLREGLEGGLVVSILLAAVRKTAAPEAGNRRAPTAPVWLGVLGAVMAAGSFAAVLTFSTSVLSSRAQDAAGGLLSVLAVGLVTSMVFWMRCTAASLSAQLRCEVQRAVTIGAGALTITAFLAVGREGLETTLFLWTAVKASGQTASPLAGAALGLAAAVMLCWLLYRRAVRLNVGVFFNRTASPEAASPEAAPARWEPLAARRPWAVAAVLIMAPAIAAGAAIAALPAPNASATTAVTVTSTGCAKDWTAARTGSQTFTVDNQSSKAGEVTLVNAAGAIVAEIETLGPATTADMSATLGPGSYTFNCRMSGQTVTTSAAVQVSGKTSQAAPAAVKPVTVQELTGPNRKYEAYAAGDLQALAGAVATLTKDLRGGNLTGARIAWLAAQLDWEKVGASYDSFGDDGLAVDGLPDGLVNGVNDKAFTGLHRLEYGLWHGQSAASLVPVAGALARDVAIVQKNLTSGDLAGDPTNLPIRAHEILEDALRDHLSGLDDQGSGAAFPETYADLQVTRVVLGELAPLIDARAPGLLSTAQAQMSTLQQALLATREHGRWTSLSGASLSARQHVDGAIGALLETLSSVPDLLEVPPGH